MIKKGLAFRKNMLKKIKTEMGKKSKKLSLLVYYFGKLLFYGNFFISDGNLYQAFTLT